MVPTYAAVFVRLSPVVPHSVGAWRWLYVYASLTYNEPAVKVKLGL